MFEDTDMGDRDIVRRWFVLNKEAYNEIGTMMKTVERTDRVKVERIHPYMCLRGSMKSKTF